MHKVFSGYRLICFKTELLIISENMQNITSKLLLRIAAIIMFAHFLGHTVGFSKWESPTGQIPVDLVQKMQNTHFMVQGKDTTIAVSFTGSGYMASIFLFLIGAILWTGSSRAGKDVSTILMLTAFAIALLVVVEFLFFFPAVAILSLSAAVLVFIAILKTGRMAQS